MLLLSPRLWRPWTQIPVYVWYIAGWWMNKGAAYVCCIVTKTASVQCQPGTGAATWCLWPFCSNTQSSAQQLDYSLMAWRQNVNKIDTEIFQSCFLCSAEAPVSLPPISLAHETQTVFPSLTIPNSAAWQEQRYWIFTGKPCWHPVFCWCVSLPLSSLLRAPLWLLGCRGFI